MSLTSGISQQCETITRSKHSDLPYPSRRALRIFFQPLSLVITLYTMLNSTETVCILAITMRATTKTLFEADYTTSSDPLCWNFAIMSSKSDFPHFSRNTRSYNFLQSLELSTCLQTILNQTFCRGTKFSQDIHPPRPSMVCNIFHIFGMNSVTFHEHNVLHMFCINCLHQSSHKCYYLSPHNVPLEVRELFSSPEVWYSHSSSTIVYLFWGRFQRSTAISAPCHKDAKRKQWPFIWPELLTVAGILYHCASVTKTNWSTGFFYEAPNGNLGLHSNSVILLSRTMELIRRGFEIKIAGVEHCT